MSGFRFMRMIVFFDLPTLTNEDKRNYRKFRKVLIKNGFIMLQEFVQTMIMTTWENNCWIILNQFRNMMGKIIYSGKIAELSFRCRDEFISAEYSRKRYTDIDTGKQRTSNS